MNPSTNALGSRSMINFTLKTRVKLIIPLKFATKRFLNGIFILSVLYLGRVVYPGSGHDRGPWIGEFNQQSSRKELRTDRLLGAKAPSQVGRLSTLQSIPTLPHRRRASAEKKRLEMNTFPHIRATSHFSPVVYFCIVPLHQDSQCLLMMRRYLLVNCFGIGNPLTSLPFT